MYKFFLRSHQYISEASCGLIKTQTWERCLGIVVTPVLSNSLILSRQPAMPTRIALLLCKLSSGCSREGSWHLKRTRRAYVSVARHRAAGVCRVVSVRKGSLASSVAMAGRHRRLLGLGSPVSPRTVKQQRGSSVGRDGPDFPDLSCIRHRPLH